MSGELIVLIYLVAIGFSLATIICYFRMCNDVRKIREMLDVKFNPKEDEKGPDKFPPTKGDVADFRKEIIGLSGEELESVIESYNKRFTEDFHQYV